MKNRSVHIIVFSVLLMTIFSLSCDLLLTTDTELPKHEPKITFVLHYPHGGWKDEVIVDVEGIIHLRRLEGDHLPEASRRLDEEELRYIRNLFEEFYSLDDEYIQYDESTTTLYTITYYGEEGEKIVRCDNSVYDHTLWGDPGYRILKKIVNELRDFRISLVGAKRFAGSLIFDFKPEKDTVKLGEPVALHYSVRNSTNSDVKMRFANLQQVGFKVYRDGELLLVYPLAFLPATSSWKIPARSTELRKAEWDQMIYDEYGSSQKVEPGTYTIVQYLLDGNSPYRANEVTIKEDN